MTLHLINKTSTAAELNTQVSQTVEPSDSILLIEDGVLQCLDSPTPVWYTKTVNTYVLSDDATARGLKVPEGYTEISYDDFVRLSVEHNKVISWY